MRGLTFLRGCLFSLDASGKHWTAIWETRKVFAIFRDVLGQLEEKRGFPCIPAPSSFDIYLSPHADHVCYFLGMLAANRRSGTLMTICSTSDFVAKRIPILGDPAERVRRVTALRLSEDRQFADAASLRLVSLGLLDAPLRGRAPFDDSYVAADSRLFEEPILQAIEHLAVHRPAGLRPWVFSPMGIGGHVDHFAVLTVVLSNLARIGAHHRIAFYEDLPYASHPLQRIKGIPRFNCAWQGPALYGVASF